MLIRIYIIYKVERKINFCLKGSVTITCKQGWRGCVLIYSPAKYNRKRAINSANKCDNESVSVIVYGFAVM